jgi:hypothetical protein
MMMDHNNERDQDNNMDCKEEVENMNKFTLANLNLKQNRNKNRGTKRKNSDGEEEDGKVEVAKTKEELDVENYEEQEVIQKTRMINARSYKRRALMIFSSLTIILFISTYFIIAYFLAMKTF